MRGEKVFVQAVGFLGRRERAGETLAFALEIKGLVRGEMNGPAGEVSVGFASHDSLATSQRPLAQSAIRLSGRPGRVV